MNGLDCARRAGRQSGRHLPEACDINVDIVVAELPPVDWLVVHLDVIDELAVERSDLRHRLLSSPYSLCPSLSLVMFPAMFPREHSLAVRSLVVMTTGKLKRCRTLVHVCRGRRRGGTIMCVFWVVCR